MCSRIRSCASAWRWQATNGRRPSPGNGLRAGRGRCCGISAGRARVPYLEMSRQRVPVLALLAGREHDYGHTARPLLHALELTHHFDIEVSTTPDALRTGRARVLIAASDAPLESEHANLVAGFVRGGGGVILLHGT